MIAHRRHSLQTQIRRKDKEARMKRIRLTQPHSLPELLIDPPPYSHFPLPQVEMTLRDRLLCLLHHLNTNPKVTLPLIQSNDYLSFLIDLYHPDLPCNDKMLLFRCLTKVFGSSLEPTFLASLESVIPRIINTVMEVLQPPSRFEVQVECLLVLGNILSDRLSAREYPRVFSFLLD